MIGLIMLGAVINYLTRSTLAVAAPTLLTELGISTKEYSYITAAFQGAIMLQPLCGYILDVIGLKFGFAMFAAAWWLITSPDAMTRVRTSMDRLRYKLTGTETAVQRYDDDADLGSLVQADVETRPSVADETWPESASDLGEMVTAGNGAAHGS